MTVSASLNVILQVPMQKAVMVRELSSKMYTPTTSFLGRYISSMIVQVIYPAIIIFLLFWNVGIVTDLENFYMLFAYATLASFVFCGQGFLIGTLIANEDQASQINVLAIMILFATSGVLANINSFSPLLRFLVDYSPSRLNCEGIFRRVTINANKLDPLINQEQILGGMAYTYGDQWCLIGLSIWFLGIIVIGLIGVNLRYKNI
uniref:ABC-2 type transporter transmembrane domain-containing protein n=1 Tax=Strombidium rassoulzadegani TaxID=1082188 RepID=A0A7S3FUI3_9SPIT|mmetsp:Transcript_17346/g.29160  ORF Transcript_17346/g.29160 Transcript_17346/m.29160 type:complete len:205 (+) Transcript_17346:1529-2143(+)